MLTYTVNVIQLQACVSRQVFIVYIQNTIYLFIIIYLKKKKKILISCLQGGDHSSALCRGTEILLGTKK